MHKNVSFLYPNTYRKHSYPFEIIFYKVKSLCQHGFIKFYTTVHFFLSFNTNNEMQDEKITTEIAVKKGNFADFQKICDKIAILLYLAYANNISMNHNFVQVRLTS